MTHNNESSPKNSLRSAMATDSRDWSANATDAWIYGIVCGWGECLPNICTRYGWAHDTLWELHNAWTAE